MLSLRHSLVCILAFLFIAVKPAVAQKCHLDKDEKDAFTGEITRSYVHFFDGPGRTSWYISFARKGDAYDFFISPVSGGLISESISVGTRLLIKLEDGTILEETLTDEVLPNYMIDGYTRWIMRFSVNESKMKKLSASPIISIKTNINDRDFYIASLKSKHGSKIQNAAACMIRKD